MKLVKKQNDIIDIQTFHQIAFHIFLLNSIGYFIVIYTPIHGNLITGKFFSGQIFKSWKEVNLT